MTEKILVVFHLYYHYQIPYFISKMKNITGVEWDLIVTGNNLTKESADAIRKFKPDARFMETENRGYDIWPFIQCIKGIDLSKYLYVIKLHTKNEDESMVIQFNGIKFRGRKWLSLMVNALLRSPERFTKNHNAFVSRPKLGLIYSMDVNVTTRDSNIEDGKMLTDELARLGIKPLSREYCAGTMFAVRASALEFLKDERIKSDIFPASKGSHNNGTLTHAYERILCIAVSAQGYQKKLIKSSRYRYCYFFVKRNIQPFLTWLFEINYHGEEHQKFLTIFGFRFKLPSKGVKNA